MEKASNIGHQPRNEYVSELIFFEAGSGSITLQQFYESNGAGQSKESDECGIDKPWHNAKEGCIPNNSHNEKIAENERDK